MRSPDHQLLTVLRGCAAVPCAAPAARVLSLAGEHGAVWLAAGLAGAAADPARRAAWLRATALVAAAHLAGMAAKRVVRRPRPHLPPGTPPLVRTAGRHSFPSAHACSSAAAALAYGALAPRVPLRPVAVAVCASRLVAGVHYPSDVAAGALLGAATVRLGRAWALGAPGAPGVGSGAGAVVVGASAVGADGAVVAGGA
ncbi:phosphatase PAP2 family protein [Actinacidiphila yeochonensis]|uniref:phosphatase PAP2 family protein n=1 Tax=Actinacidiphila yeochonensis TaxID=89050 RepID=UPI00099DC2EB|nr:phosphatase PAP2 family protein [Actinacidiphila yeochonensis]